MQLCVMNKVRSQSFKELEKFPQNVSRICRLTQLPQCERGVTIRGSWMGLIKLGKDRVANYVSPNVVISSTTSVP